MIVESPPRGAGKFCPVHGAYTEAERRCPKCAAFCVSCAMHVENAGHARDCPQGQMEARDRRIAELERVLAEQGRRIAALEALPCSECGGVSVHLLGCVKGPALDDVTAFGRVEYRDAAALKRVFIRHASIAFARPYGVDADGCWIVEDPNVCIDRAEELYNRLERRGYTEPPVLTGR